MAEIVGSPQAIDDVESIPEFQDPGLREILWRNYRLVYRTSRGLIEVVTVFNGSRLFVVDGSLGT